MDTIVEKTFILNLDYRIDRMMSMVDLMTELKIKNWERFEAIRPERFKDIDKDLFSGYNRFHKLNKKYVKGSVGCKMSHIAMIEEARKKRYKNVLILEDDLEFIGDMNHLEIAFRELEDVNWDILYLGLNKESVEGGDNHIFIDRVKKGLCTHAYIVNGKSYYKILKILKASNKQVDVTYQDNFDNLRCYIVRPKQFRQNKSYSDINRIFL